MCSMILIPLAPISVFDPMLVTGGFVLFAIAIEFAAKPVVSGVGVLEAIGCSGVILSILNYGHLH